MLVSIVICTYNYGPFLAGAIDSALAQIDQAVEVIVVDDGSTDESAQVSASYGPRIIAISQSNQGQVSAYNRGFHEARGDYVIFLDADDTLDPQTSRVVTEAFQDPAVVKVHYRLRLVDAAGVALGEVIPRSLDSGELGWMLKEGMFYASSPGSGNAYRRSALAQLFPLPVATDDPHAADFFTIMGISLLGELRAVEDSLGTYRVHAAQATHKIGFGNASEKEQAKVAQRYSRLRGWLLGRLGPAARLPEDFIDFATQKQLLASAIFNQGYLEGLRDGSEVLRRGLLRSIWKRPSSRIEKLGLSGWAVAICVLPRPVGRPLARYVCNPASRSSAVPAWLSGYFRRWSDLSRG